jgi:DNA polymerase (family 10)
MGFNAIAAQKLELMAAMLDLLGEDSFRASAHSRAARQIGDSPEDLEHVSREALLKMPGIGAKMADKIIELRTTGSIKELDELASRVPAGLLELLKVPGLGPKTVRLFWTDAGVTDAASLQRIIDDGSILKLPRMGEKKVQQIKESLAFAARAGADQRAWIGIAQPLAMSIVKAVGAIPGVERVQYAGSLRRGKETIGDIDVLASLKDGVDAQNVAEAFRALPGVTRVLAAGANKSSVMVSTQTDMGRWKSEDSGGGPSDIQVDLRIVPRESFGAALMYFTGSKEHNVAMRQRALARGLTLNEYGLFPEDKEDSPPQSRGIKPVASAREEDVFEALGLPYVPPEIRESHGELDLSQTPRLVELSDIKAELHAHTTASDGTLSIEQLARAAHARGFHTIAVTDHSKSSAIAGGLSPERLRAHIVAVREAEKKLQDSGVDIRILAGSEVDILVDGSLDYDDDLLAALDIVVASPHASTRQDPGPATARLLRAIRHPLVHIIGHPTARLINRRPGMEPVIAELVAAAREHNTALEINAHWLRLDLRDVHVRAAAGCLIAIDCDVHAPEDFDNLRYGVLTARRGWLTADRCVNTWTRPELEKWLTSKR